MLDHDLEDDAAARRIDYLGQHWLSWLVQRFVDLLLFRKAVSRLWIPLRSIGRYVTVTQYKSLGHKWMEEAKRWTVIKIGPLYSFFPDHGNHDGIVYAAVNTAIKQEKSVEEFDVQHLLDEGVSAEKILQARLQAGEDHPYTLETITDFGLSLLKQQHSQEAEDLLWWAWVGREGEPGAMSADDPGDLTSIFRLGGLYMEHAHYELAEKYLTQALKGYETTFGEEDPLTIGLLNMLVDLYESCDKPDEMTKWRSKLRQTEGVEERSI